MPGSELVKVIRTVIEEIWNQGALDLTDILFAPDYVNHGGLIPDLVRGPEAIKFSVALYRLAFPALQIAIEDLSVESGIATLRWTARGTPAGSKRALTGVTLGRFAGRQIAESWTFWNAEGDRCRPGPGPLPLDRPVRVHNRVKTNGFVA
jgi:SnoaL-like polyketide cyclase